jgi:hypothetical protein
VNAQTWNFFRCHPVAKVEWVVGADHDVIGANHVFQAFDSLDLNIVVVHPAINPQETIAALPASLRKSRRV